MDSRGWLRVTPESNLKRLWKFVGRICSCFCRTFSSPRMLVVQWLQVGLNPRQESLMLHPSHEGTWGRQISVPSASLFEVEGLQGLQCRLYGKTGLTRYLETMWSPHIELHQQFKAQLLHVGLQFLGPYTNKLSCP